MPSAWPNSRTDLADAPGTRPFAARRRQVVVDAIVPDAHLNAAVAGIRGLGWAGLQVLAVGPSWTAPGLWSRQTTARAVTPSVTSKPGAYGERLAALAADCGPTVLYPSREETIDAMLANATRWRDIVLPFPTGDVLERVRDKGRLVRTARDAGLETPASLFEGPACDLHDMRFSVPVVVKPARPVSRLKTARLVRSAAHMESILAEVPAHERLLVQQRARGPLTSVELVLDREGQVAARFQHVTRRTWPPAAGSIALATSVEPDEQLVARAAAMLADIGYWGLAQVDFVHTAAGYVLLDVNPRFYRCLPLAIACGTNLPALWHAVTVGRPVGKPRAYRTGVTYRWLEADFVAAARGIPRRLAGRAPQPHIGASWTADDPVPGFLLGAWAVRDRMLRFARLRSNGR